MRIRVIGLSGLITAGVVSAALAHASLITAEPAAGSEMKSAPSEVRLEFGEELESSFSKITVANDKGSEVATGDPVIEGARMTVPLKPLEPGIYTVKWRALSVDGHVTEGEYRFTVLTP